MCRCSFFSSLFGFYHALFDSLCFIFFLPKSFYFIFFSFEIHSSFYYCLFLYATDHLYRSVCRFNFDLIHAFFFNFFLRNKKKVEGKKTRTHTKYDKNGRKKEPRTRVTATLRRNIERGKKWKLTRQINWDYSGLHSCLWSISALLAFITPEICLIYILWVVVGFFFSLFFILFVECLFA